MSATHFSQSDELGSGHVFPLLYNLVYCSRATSLMDDAEVKRILDSAHRRNPAQGITGLLVYGSGHTGLNGGAVGAQVVKIVLAKQALPWHEALLRGVLCNVLVCLAVWMAMAGRSVVDKAVAVVLPVATFVAAGLEHSIANLYLWPLALLIQGDAAPGVSWLGWGANLLPVVAGNLLGGSLLVGLAYHLIYPRPEPS